MLFSGGQYGVVYILRTLVTSPQNCSFAVRRKIVFVLSFVVTPATCGDKLITLFCCCEIVFLRACMCVCVRGRGSACVLACVVARKNANDIVWRALRLLCHASGVVVCFRLVQDDPGPGDALFHRLPRVRCAGHHLHLRPLHQQVRHGAAHYHYGGCRR